MECCGVPVADRRPSEFLAGRLGRLGTVVRSGVERERDAGQVSGLDRGVSSDKASPSRWCYSLLMFHRSVGMGTGVRGRVLNRLKWRNVFTRFYPCPGPQVSTASPWRSLGRTRAPTGATTIIEISGRSVRRKRQP